MKNGGFVLGGKSAKELGIIMKGTSSRPILPGTVDAVLAIPGRHGAYDFGATLGARQFLLDCAFITRNAQFLQSAVRNLAAHLLDEYGRPKTMELIFDNEPDKFYMVRYSGNLPIDRVTGFGSFSLPLVAYDPYAYLIYSTNEEIYLEHALLLESDIFLDYAPYIFDVKEPVEIEINNFGLTGVAPIIEVNGSFDELSLSVNGRTITYVEPFNGVLTIDGEKMTVTSGTENVLGNTTGDFPFLIRGQNDVIISGTGLNCSVSFVFRPRFL